VTCDPLAGNPTDLAKALRPFQAISHSDVELPTQSENKVKIL